MILNLSSLDQANLGPAANGGEMELACDLCIVGSGAAGLAIAHEMRNTPLRVVLLESGGLDQEAATQALYDVEISGLPHPGATEGRFRVFGGSTTRWGGQALPLLPTDFEARDWVAHSGWPLKFDDLVPFYDRAAEFLLVDRMNFESDLFPFLQTRPPEFDPRKVWYHFSKWSPQPDLRERHLPAIRSSERCTLVLHANVTKITLNENLNEVACMEVCSLEGRRACVRARAFALCVGGIETARLLLANNRQQPGGLGNAHDLVGRYFQDHPNIVAGWLKTSDPRHLQRLFNVFHKNRVKYSVRCTAPPQWQREQRMLSVSMGFMFLEEGSALQNLKEAYLAMRQGKINAGVFRKSLRAAAHPRDTLSPMWHFAVRGRSFSPHARFQVCLTCEQEPDPESRIQLSAERDPLGMPRANVRWTVTDLTWQTLLAYTKLLCEEFRRIGLGEIELEPWMHNGYHHWRDHITDQYHHMGTTRMHESPRQGVVDRHCRVHGIRNLYIGSSSVFPTSGHSNPTMTILALCMRLADLLKQELGRPR